MSFYRQRTPQFDMRVVGLVLLVLTLLFVVRTHEARGQVLEAETRPYVINASEKALEDIKFLTYLSQDTVEFAMCVEGEYTPGANERVKVTRVVLATVRSTGPLTVNADYASCMTPRTIGLLHSHTNKAQCSISDPDVYVFFRNGDFLKYNLTFISCSGLRLIAYNRNQAKIAATEEFIRRRQKKPESFTEVLLDIQKNYQTKPAVYLAGPTTVP